LINSFSSLEDPKIEIFGNLEEENFGRLLQKKMVYSLCEVQDILRVVTVMEKKEVDLITHMEYGLIIL
jgi:hypothetical protein